MNAELRLGSVVAHGVGGPEAGALNLIYTKLLRDYDQRSYSYIGINQIGHDLNEFIAKESGKSIHINIRYPIYDDFEGKTVKEKNLIRLDAIHTALTRIALQENSFNVEVLERIRSQILENDFSFEFLCKRFERKKSHLIAKILVRPLMDKFEFYVEIEKKALKICRVLLYNGLTLLYYFSELFSNCKWLDDNELIIVGKRKEVEFKVRIDECKLEIVNLTHFPESPYFNMMRGDLSTEERQKRKMDWQQSLPPAIAAAIRGADNRV